VELSETRRRWVKVEEAYVSDGCQKAGSAAIHGEGDSIARGLFYQCIANELASVAGSHSGLTKQIHDRWHLRQIMPTAAQPYIIAVRQRWFSRTSAVPARRSGY
jgi:hypothetical protein